MSEPTAPTPPPQLAEEDYYYEGKFLVFTAAFLRKRGYCCYTGCRHCPYDMHGNLIPPKGA
jgi:hypothetical protein